MKLFKKRYRNMSKDYCINPVHVIQGELVYCSDIVLSVISKVYPNQNVERLDEFINNVSNKKIDSIRVITYDIEGQVYLKYLFYDGKSILYIKDGSKLNEKFEPPYILRYEGSDIIKKSFNSYEDYYLEDFNNNEILMFTKKLN